MMTIVAIAAALALSALVAGLTIRDKTARPKAYRLVFGLAFLLFFGASNKLVLPMLSSHYAMADFEAGLEKNPAFVAIRQYDPALYNELLQDMRTAISEGMTPDQLSAFIRDKAASVVQQRIGHASNESVARLVEVSQKQSKVLQMHGNGLCFEYLFPKPGKPSDAAKYIDMALTREELTVMGDVIKDSATNPQVEPTLEQVRPYLLLASKGLAKKYRREELTMLDNPYQPGVDKEKVCSMSLDLYGQILSLPLEQKGPLLRFMLKASATL